MFFERLKSERKRLKLTQEELATLVGTTKKSQGEYESGKIAPSSNYLELLAPLGFDIQYMITGIRSEMPLSPDDRELLAIYKNASDTIKMAVKAVLLAGFTARYKV